MPFLTPPWRSFPSLTSHTEAASASTCCNFSFATLEIASCHPGAANFALTEQRQSDAWRWAICSCDGIVLYGGSESSQSGAKKTSEDALRREEPAEEPELAWGGDFTD